MIGKTSLLWSQEYSEDNVVGYRMQGSYLDIMIRYYDRGGDSYQADLTVLNNHFMPEEDDNPETIRFTVSQERNGTWWAHNGYFGYEYKAHSRDEAVLNSWLQRHMVMSTQSDPKPW